MSDENRPASSICPKCQGARFEMIINAESQRFRCLSCNHMWEGSHLRPKPDRRHHDRLKLNKTKPSEK